MRFKYHKEIAQFECDLLAYQQCEAKTAFRWVFEEIHDPRNFEPKFKLDQSFQRNTCIGWALSFFNTQENAKKRLLHITKDKEHLFKKLGTHIANGLLEKVDGVSNDPEKFGHFSHFEYENIT